MPSRSAPRRISGAGVVQASTPVASTASVALAAIPNAVHSPSSLRPTPSTVTSGPAVTNGSSTMKAMNGISIAIRPASMLSRRAGGDRHRGEQRGIDRVGPDELAARHERDGDDEEDRGQHLALGGRAVQRRLDGGGDLVGAAHSRLPRPARAAGTITVDMYGPLPLRAAAAPICSASRPSSSP